MTENQRAQLYFVDEAGDSTIFSRTGKIIIGCEGCSRFFILGLLEVSNLDSLNTDLKQLRANLLSDPYFKGVPSMQPEARKTALAFHAKDDIPEVRREVFKLLCDRDDLRFFAVVSDKFSTLSYIKNRQSADLQYHYRKNEDYDFLVRRIFKERLHQSNAYQIVFAKRGNRERDRILQQQLEISRSRHTKATDDPPAMQVSSGLPKDHPGLQATDYFLWALQRLYERHEDRFLVPLWQRFRLVMDIHDTRNHNYGEYYHKRNPLTWDKIKGRM
ncbi:MAG: DUF3800 domain-containing protein [Chloroflexi bacterium]|jgi:hypothetical protein|nr:DUF3800 domain-containing protein [Chloroflexota bacterium]